VQPIGRRGNISYYFVISYYFFFFYYYHYYHYYYYYYYYDGLVRLRYAGAAAYQSRWHVHFRDDGNAGSQRECVRGQLRVR
tara:strand:+ start:196 stop:438 length:243 start_codon:yes stop_codon:yes gene_type:complete